MTVAMNDLPLLLDRIRALVDEQAESDPELLLERIEHTLTDGYAHALALEGESMRIEREIGATVARVGDGLDPDGLTALTERLAATEGELRRLRQLLGMLSRRADGVRATV